MMTYLLFEEMWFAFPTPFHSGDIVCSRFSPDEPFVLTDMVTWDSERMMKELPPSEYDRQMLDCADWTIERLLGQGDSRIMGAFGYRAEGGLIRRQKAPICDYLDLEYYRGSLDCSHKILQPVSTYLKGNCGIEFLLNAYCLLLAVNTAGAGRMNRRKMDIYRFIDSRDMREHLQKLNYSFTTPEAAFLVYWCKAATLEERIAAWREIIDTMPNCAMAERLNLEAIPDFHQFLRDYIDLQERTCGASRSRRAASMSVSCPGRVNYAEIWSSARSVILTAAYPHRSGGRQRKKQSVSAFSSAPWIRVRIRRGKTIAS